MALPCKNKWDNLNDAIAAYEDCWEEVDDDQFGVELVGMGAAVACPAAVAKPGTETAAACTLAAGGVWHTYKQWIKKMNKCNKLVLEALVIAYDFQKCTAKHKDVLNAAAKANAANN